MTKRSISLAISYALANPGYCWELWSFRVQDIRDFVGWEPGSWLTTSR